MSESPQSPKSTPATTKQKLGGLFVGLILGSLGVWMIVNPQSPIHGDTEPTRARTGLIVTALDWIWGLPGGIILLLLTLLIVWGSFLPNTEEDAKK